MRGVQFLNDKNGKRSKAIVDLSLYGKEFAVFLEELSKKYESQKTLDKNPFGAVLGAGNQPKPMRGNQQGMTAVNARIAKVNMLIELAQRFFGTPYRTGGTTASGMDCSGLIYTLFRMIGVSVPRVSKDQAMVGHPLNYRQVQPGDLIFFATSTPNRINHVGLVSKNDQGLIKFIHASSSRGVMESSMQLNYWKKAYMTARRVF